jgi:hypothetical protein
MSPFAARLSATSHDLQSHRFLGTGLKLVRQLSTTGVVKDNSTPLSSSTPAKSQLSAKLVRHFFEKLSLIGNNLFAHRASL